MLAQQIREIYPDIDFESAVILQDDGNGAHIAAWRDPRPRPTQAELDAKRVPALASMKRAEIDAECRRRERAVMNGADPLDLVINPTDPRIAQIAAIRQARDNAKTDVLSRLPNEASINAYNAITGPNWP